MAKNLKSRTLKLDPNEFTPNDVKRLMREFKASLKVAGQNHDGLMKAIAMTHTLRKDREWLVDEVRRLRGILDDAGIEYEKRELRTPEQVEEGNERFGSD